MAFEPDSALIKYMAKRLEFEKERIIVKRRGGRASELKEFKQLKDAKQYVLKKVFESMANLIFFFECVNKYPELDNDMRDYVLELLGLIGKVDLDMRRTTFERLLCAVLFDNFAEEPSLDYRLRLACKMHKITTKVIGDNINPKSSSNPLGPYSIGALQAIDRDLQASQAWAETMAKQVRVDLKRQPGRTVVVNSNIGK